MSDLQSAIDAGQLLGRCSYYFGCWNRPGHFWHNTQGGHIWENTPPDMPWVWRSLADGGLLRNGKHPDIYDGKVFWTCGGAKAFWYAFVWWDRSVDRRGACNSGLYVRGFGWPEANDAFEYGCAEFPSVIARQKHPLVLQDADRGRGD